MCLASESSKSTKPCTRKWQMVSDLNFMENFCNMKAEMKVLSISISIFFSHRDSMNCGLILQLD